MSGDFTPGHTNGAEPAIGGNGVHKSALADGITPPTSDDTRSGQAEAMRDGKTASLRPPIQDAGAERNAGTGVLSESNGTPPNGKPPLHQRWRDRDFREILTTGLKEARRGLIVVGIFSFWVNFLILAVPIYLFNISDRVLTSRSTDTLVMLSVVIVGAIFGHVILDMVRRVMLMRIAVDVETRLGGPVVSAAARASLNGSNWEFQILGDLQQVRNFITGPVLLTMLDAPVAPLYLATVFLIHPDLGWIVAGTGVALLGFAVLNQRLTVAPFTRAATFMARANVQADAMARNASVMNAMGMVPEGVQLWMRETVESLRSQVRAQNWNALITGLSKFTRLCTQIAILGWGAALALDGRLTGGMMIAASIVGSRALAPIEGTIDGWRSFISARLAFTRVKVLLQNSSLNLDRLRVPRPVGIVDVERVLYVPPPTKKVILNGISLHLDPGESLAIVGPSGSGKSTFARMLVGSIAPTAGNIRLDLMDLRNWDPLQLGENVGYLPQDVQLFPASIKANIARMREDATDEAIFNAAEMADVHELISSFPQGYETMVAMDGAPLSGGQKQRVALARAFFNEPRLVVLDEPNSNLDTPGEAALAKALLRAKQKGITVVAVTQRPALLSSVDKIMLIREGTVQAMGTRDEILPAITGRAPTVTAVPGANPAPSPFDSGLGAGVSQAAT